ncbi:MAG: Holliday junction resolvase RuvX [Acidobacteriota bacterium]
MRILGIDFGDRVIGLALSDESKTIAFPLDSYRRKNEKSDYEYFKKIVDNWKIEKIIVGNPVRMNGSAGVRVKKTEDFVEWLKKNFNVDIELWDERLSTKEAEKLLLSAKMKWKKRRKIVDKISASLILESYLYAVPTKED